MNLTLRNSRVAQVSNPSKRRGRTPATSARLFRATLLMTATPPARPRPSPRRRRTAPYMHDGSLATLEDVVDYYDRGGNANPGLDQELRPLHLSGTVREGIR